MREQQEKRQAVGISDSRQEPAPRERTGKRPPVEDESDGIGPGVKLHMLGRSGDREQQSILGRFQNYAETCQPITLDYLRRINLLTDSKMYYIFVRLGKSKTLVPILVTEGRLIKVSLISEKWADSLVRRRHAHRVQDNGRTNDQWICLDLSWPFDVENSQTRNDGTEILFEA